MEEEQVELEIPPMLATALESGKVLGFVVLSVPREGTEKLCIHADMHPKISPYGQMEVCRLLMRAAMEKARILARDLGMSDERMRKFLSVDDTFEVAVWQKGESDA